MQHDEEIRLEALPHDLPQARHPALHFGAGDIEGQFIAESGADGLGEALLQRDLVQGGETWRPEMAGGNRFGGTQFVPPRQVLLPVAEAVAPLLAGILTRAEWLYFFHRLAANGGE